MVLLKSGDKALYGCSQHPGRLGNSLELFEDFVSRQACAAVLLNMPYFRIANLFLVLWCLYSCMATRVLGPGICCIFNTSQKGRCLGLVIEHTLFHGSPRLNSKHPHLSTGEPSFISIDECRPNCKPWLPSELQKPARGSCKILMKTPLPYTMFTIVALMGHRCQWQPKVKGAA